MEITNDSYLFKLFLSINYSMRKVVFIFLFLIGFSMQIFAQQWIKHGMLDTIHVKLALIKSDNPTQKEINQTIRAISYTKLKHPETVRIDWKIITSFQVTRHEKGHFITDLYIKPLASEGDIEIYNFDASNYILPQLKSFRIRIFKEDSSLVYLKYYDGDVISVKSIGEIAGFRISHQRWSKGWFIHIDQFELEYNKADYLFEDWFQYVSDYKAADYIVSNLFKEYKIKQQNLQEAFPFLIKSIRQANFLKKLYELPFYRVLILDDKDPANLKNKMDVFSALLDLNIEKYANFIRSSKHSGSISTDQIVESYLLEDQYLLKIQHSYENIYDDLFKVLAETDYPKNLSYNDFHFFDLVSISNPFEKNQLSHSFEKRLYQLSIENIDSLIYHQQFSDALFYINNIEGFAKQTNDLEINEFFGQKKALGAHGMYNSFISVVDKALKIKNIKLAEQYIEKASLVQKKYSQEIITNGLAEKKIVQMLEICYLDYAQLIQKDKFTEASAKRDTIRHIINTFQFENTEFVFELNISPENKVLIE